jgi:hypothetical protein
MAAILRASVRRAIDVDTHLFCMRIGSTGRPCFVKGKFCIVAGRPDGEVNPVPMVYTHKAASIPFTRSGAALGAALFQKGSFVTHAKQRLPT